MARQKYMYARKKDKQPIAKLVGAIFMITLICIGTLYGYQRYSNPPLYGKWVSKETGETVTFNRNGTVDVEDPTQQPIFELVAPSKMIYTIDKKVFEMSYELEGRQLTWGVEGENLEFFKRK